MSQLVLTMPSGVFNLNITSFASPVYQQITSAQTKHMAVHFPIKIAQPNVTFNAIFRGEAEFQDFQTAVRNSQTAAVESNTLITMWWPERSILNWTGIIKRIVAGGKRFNVAPTASFEVELVDSLASQRTEFGSIASDWTSIFGQNMGGNAVLALPSAAEAQQILTEFGQNIYNSGQALVGGFFGGILSGTG